MGQHMEVISSLFSEEQIDVIDGLWGLKSTMQGQILICRRVMCHSKTTEILAKEELVYTTKVVCFLQVC